VHVSYINREVIPKLSEDGKNGGIIIAGWSSGNLTLVSMSGWPGVVGKDNLDFLDGLGWVSFLSLHSMPTFYRPFISRSVFRKPSVRKTTIHSSTRISKIPVEMSPIMTRTLVSTTALLLASTSKRNFLRILGRLFGSSKTLRLLECSVLICLSRLHLLQPMCFEPMQ